MKRVEHNIKVDDMRDALNKIWHHGYEARPADPENTPHVKDIFFAGAHNAIIMIVVEYDWEEGIPIPFEQWDTLDEIEHVYHYVWETEANGCPQGAFRGA